MTSRIALVLTLLLAAACGPAAEDDPGDSAFDAVAAGAFLPRDPWIEVADVYRARRAVEAESADWRLPYATSLEVVDGWGGAEEWGAWGLGDRTRARFVLRDPRPYDFAITAMAPPDPEARPQAVRVMINGRLAGDFTAGDDWETHRLPVPPELLRRGVNELELVYGYHLESGLDNDDRPLALGFERLGLLPAGQKPPAKGHPGFRVYHDQEILVLSSPGAYVMPLEVPAASTTFEFDLQATGDRGTLRVEALSVDGRKTPLAALGGGDAGRQSLDLEAHRGAPLLLVVEAEPAPGERFTIRQPRRVTREAPAVAGHARVAEPPPIVLIVLDAARADHFGVYGYERDTTPHIDALAAESLVFRDAVAECSYTLCSMPGLLTGLSYVQHGMVRKELVLRDEVETLAEILSAAGYVTLGYTGNPNNSHVTGTDQGFDEFYEIWKTHPRHITRRASRRLGRADVAARPFFLMLHYVPPHEPYAPDPEFDVFGDPAYDGPVTSDREFTRAVYAGQIELDDADLAEMVALYDGNLRMADDAVGQVLARLESLGLYEESMVIVTSDHGEAFLEHGRVGHNSTVYEEMIRVPMIVKLPAGWEAAPDLDRLVTLADVPATILGMLGLDAPTALYGRDLLTTDGAPERVVYLRSAQATNPVLGVRTPRFKATVGNGGPRLFDLAADPREEVDVVGEHPLVHAGLSLILARALRAPEPLRAGTRDGEISDEDKAMLRALGYL